MRQDERWFSSSQGRPKLPGAENAGRETGGAMLTLSGL